jgi:hypothetical protein
MVLMSSVNWNLNCEPTVFELMEDIRLGLMTIDLSLDFMISVTDPPAPLSGHGPYRIGTRTGLVAPVGTLAPPA